MSTHHLDHRERAGASPPPDPSGFTFLEVILAAAMLAVLFSIAGQLIVNMKRQTRLVERHSLALHDRELDGRASRNAVGQDRRRGNRSFAAARRGARCWPDAALTGSVTPSSDPVEAKRISLSLSLSPEARTHPASLTTWIYRRPRE